MAAPVLRIAPITFDYINGAKDCLGFSAEQLHAIDPRLVNLDAQGRPDSIRWEALAAHIVVCLQAFDKRIAALEAAQR
jgi:hypothetical protein